MFQIVVITLFRLIACRFREYVLVLTEEFAGDLGGSLHCGKSTIPYLLPITDIFQLKIHWTEVQSCFLRVR